MRETASQRLERERAEHAAKHAPGTRTTPEPDEALEPPAEPHVEADPAEEE